MSSFYQINGGVPLNGTIRVQGAKNSVLPILAASIVRPGVTYLHNCPDIRDVDAAIAIASCRQSMEYWSQPIIDFEAANAFLHAEAAEHPLLENPVANDVTLIRSLLITGANASGKSTYLKAVILCALLALFTVAP